MATMLRVYPKLIDDVLCNPGMGFKTFQRFNGDDLNPGTQWSEGNPIEFQPDSGRLHAPNFPRTSMAYFRLN